MVKMESVNEKCTGVKKIDWEDNLKGMITMGIFTHSYFFNMKMYGSVFHSHVCLLF